MKIRLFAALLFMGIALAGCGSGEVVVSPAPLITTKISSSLSLDGYVVENPVTLALTSVQNTASLFAGLDPTTGAEYRAFIGFPLGGVGGVPGNAIIDSATLDIIINDVQIQPLNASVPIRIELVSFGAPLLPNDFDRIILPPLAFTTISPPISRTAIGFSVVVDVTVLMREAQRLALPAFQVRILEDFGFVTPGLIEIDDSTTVRAPQLTVKYF